MAQREVSTQNYVNSNSGGDPLYNTGYTNLTGTPYFSNQWNKGIVKFKNGKTYKDIKIKYDQIADKLVFENEGKALYFTDPIIEFKFNSITNNKEESYHFKNGFNSDPLSFYQVLDEDKISLLKKDRKIIVDKTPFNSATAIKTIEPQIKYYLYYNDQLKNIKMNKKSILTILVDKKDQLEAFFNKENIDFIQEEDLIKIIKYYNSIEFRQ